MDRPQNNAIVRINSDLPCQIYRFGKEIGCANTHDYTEIYLPKGRHRLSFVSIENTNDRVDFEKEILDVEYEDIIDVCIKPIKNARLAKESVERKREQERLALLRRIEEEKRMKEEAMKPYKIAPYLRLNFYDSISFRRFYYNPEVYILASKGGFYSILNDSFLPKFPFKFEEIKECGDNKDCLWVRKNKKWGLYNYKQKKYLVSPRFEDISVSRTNTIVEIFDRSSGSHKLGVMNNKGELFIDCIYHDLRRSSGYYSDKYFKAKLNDMEGLLDEYGRVKLNFVYKDLWLDGEYPTEYRGKYGVFDGKGDVILDFIYDKIEYRDRFGYGYHLLLKNGKYGIHVCATGEIIPCKYNSEEEIPNFNLYPF